VERPGRGEGCLVNGGHRRPDDGWVKAHVHRQQIDPLVRTNLVVIDLEQHLTCGGADRSRHRHRSCLDDRLLIRDIGRGIRLRLAVDEFLDRQRPLDGIEPPHSALLAAGRHHQLTDGGRAAGEGTRDGGRVVREHRRSMPQTVGGLSG
jgi:hypothetical protein